MIKEFVALTLALLIGSRVLPAAEFRLEGQVMNGTSLFPPSTPVYGIPYYEYGAPAGGFPIDFVARLALGTSEKDWTFQFTLTDDERATNFSVGGPNVAGRRPDLMTNSVERTDRQISIQFANSPLASETFALSLDLAGGRGTWEWRLDCPVCDLQYPRPSASAIVSAIFPVPEPTTDLCVAFGAAIVFAIRRARPTRCFAIKPRQG